MEVWRARKRAWGVVSIALAICGCGKTAAPDNPTPTTPDPSDPEPQERLVRWQLEADGTAPLTLGIFDQTRGEHCSFVLDREGTLRCLPLPATTVELQLNYADAACTQPIYYAPYAKNAQVLLDRSVAVPLPSEGCETRYAVGTLKEIPPTQRFYRSATGCVALGPPAQEEGSHDFVLEREADPQGWVSAKEIDGPLLGDRVRLRRFATDDQGEFDAQLVDERWDKPCTVMDATDAPTCNVATLPNHSNYYVDSKCQGEHLWPATTCPEPAYIGDFGFSGEKSTLGALWDGPIFSQGKVCEPADTSYEGQEGYWQRGEPLGPDAIATVGWTDEGTGRLRLVGLRADDGSLQVISDALFGGSSLGRSSHTPRFQDSQLDVGCRPIWTPDAGVRCVPSTTLVDPYTYLMFADADCTDPAYLCTVPEDCPYSDLVTMAYDDNGEYRAVSRRAAVRLSGEPIYSLAGGKCTRNEPTATPLYLRAGAELPWDEYPQLLEQNGRAPGAR
jgi:hypothetical protein